MIDHILGTVVCNMVILLQINKITFENKSKPGQSFNRKLWFF